MSKNNWLCLIDSLKDSFNFCIFIQIIIILIINMSAQNLKNIFQNLIKQNVNYSN